MDSSAGSATFSRKCLRLDLCPPTASSQEDETSRSTPVRKKPILDFNDVCIIDPTLSLENQSWYHGSISRSEAECLLYPTREGSYLVRTCVTSNPCRHGGPCYSIAIKSAKGFMHLKIVRDSDASYVLGVFSKAFKSIPEMIHYYSLNRLPIKGAEHMSLRNPILYQLLWTTQCLRHDHRNSHSKAEVLV